MAMAVTVGHAALHARHAFRVSRTRARARHQRFPWPARDRLARAAAAVALAPSPGRSRARGAAAAAAGAAARAVTAMQEVAMAMAMAVAVAVEVAVSYSARASRKMCFTRAYTYVITAHRASHYRFRSHRARPAHARGGFGCARLLVRSRAHAHAVWRWRGGWRWRSVTTRVTRITRAARHTHVFIRHQCASRESSPVSAPPRTTGTRAWRRRRRSLVARFPARGAEERAMEGARAAARAYDARHAHHARLTCAHFFVINVRRASHHRFPFPPHA